MNRTLSSATTFFHKYVFPALWIPGFGIATAAVFRNPAELADVGTHAPPLGMQWIFLAGWLTGVAFIVWMAVPLKRVRLENGGLIVSNYLREWRIPLSLVAEVTQNRWINARPITIRLRADVGCGTRIVFIPRWHFRLGFWREDPEVEELRRLMGVGVVRG